MIPTPSHRDAIPPEISISHEREAPRSWLFTLTLNPLSDRPPSTHEITLSWADYEHWSHGSASPSRIAESAIRAALDANPHLPLPARLDLSTLRRHVPDFDRRMSECG